MPAPPARADVFPAGAVVPATVKTKMAEWFDYTLALLGAAGTAASARASLGVPAHNVAINGGFTINQRGYVSAAVLAAGSYGHDRWQAGAGGGDYSFTQLASDTTITIAANKTLIQVVEDKNVQATGYVVSWTGTALGRVGVNTATPAGAYAASPILTTGQTAGTTMSVEFGNGASAGTLGKVMIEPGTAVVHVTAFESRPYATELTLCKRYLPSLNGAGGMGAGYVSNTNTIANISIKFDVEARVAPTGVTVSAATDFQQFSAGGGGACSAVAFAFAGTTGAVINATAAAGTIGYGAYLQGANSSAKMLFTGCEL